jgi:hypothetical protein
LASGDTSHNPPAGLEPSLNRFIPLLDEQPPIELLGERVSLLLAAAPSRSLWTEPDELAAADGLGDPLPW